jgi:hypothetical protein
MTALSFVQPRVARAYNGGRGCVGNKALGETDCENNY